MVCSIFFPLNVLTYLTTFKKAGKKSRDAPPPQKRLRDESDESNAGKSHLVFLSMFCLFNDLRKAGKKRRDAPPPQKRMRDDCDVNSAGKIHPFSS